jgi:hypothetical protein
MTGSGAAGRPDPARYRDPEGLFEAAVPDGWTIDKVERGVGLKKGAAYANILTMTVAARGLPQALAQQVGGQWKQFRVLDEGQAGIGAFGGEYVLAAGVNPRGLPAAIRIAAAQAGAKSLVLLISAPESDWKSLAADLKAIEAGLSVPGVSAPATLAAPAVVPSAASRYRDPRGLFEAAVPAGWTAVEAENGVNLKKGSAYANVLTMTGAARGLPQSLARQVGGQWKQFRQLDEGQARLGPLSGEYVLAAGVNPLGTPAAIRIAAAQAGGNALVLLVSAPDSDWKSLAADFQAIEAGISTGGAPPAATAPPAASTPAAPFLGVRCVELDTDRIRQSPTAKGALITAIAPGSPAETVGLEPGDILLEANRTAVTRASDFVNAVSAQTPGARLELLVWRKGEYRSFVVTLAAAPQ